MGRFIDLTGQRFGKLTAVSYDLSKHRWHCVCDCGGSSDIFSKYLRDGSRTDCGCRAYAAASERIRAGVTGCRGGTNIYVIQRSMEGRKRRSNTSGATGVAVISTVRKGVKYRACISVRGRNIYLGTFDTLEAAVATRKAAEEKYFVPLINADRKAAKRSADVPADGTESPTDRKGRE